MAVTTGALGPSCGVGSWRTPLVIIICGCAIALLSFGPRSSLGFFVQPMGREFAWGRDVFGLALALQNLRLDLLKLRSSGLESAMSDVASATQEARALSRDIGHVLEAAKQVRE